MLISSEVLVEKILCECTHGNDIMRADTRTQIFLQ